MNEPQAAANPPLPPFAGHLDDALRLVEFLRARCEWDAAQTHHSLRRYLLEESHEVIEAIDANDDESLRDELGDLLLNLAFQIVIAEERAAFDRVTVVEHLKAKMRRRHTRIYGDAKADGDAATWEALKAAERGDATAGARGLLGNLVSGSDSLAHAHRVQSTVASVGFERLSFWAGRKAAFPAVGRISPDYYCMDGTIPRKQLPKVLAGMRELSEKYGLRVANVFHAGDGNLHPLILYDANKPGELDKAESFGADILRLCVAVGGVLTGEHGVGVEKRDLMGEMFNQIDLDQQMRVKCAFDPNHLLNPGKVFPQLRRCAELGRMHVSGGKLPFPSIPRF